MIAPKTIVLAVAGLSAIGGVTTAAVKSADFSSDVKTSTERRSEQSAPPQNVTYEFVFPGAVKKALTCPHASYPQDSLDYSNTSRPIIIACSKGKEFVWTLKWNGSDAQYNKKKLTCSATQSAGKTFNCTSELSGSAQVNVEELQLSSNWNNFYSSQTALKIT
ncbi:hypothetical protein MHLP_01250 [Candidatus Mycoplasma haematolamae str. Purdue]|uniref:Ig-like domain-containing protein n=1 Tax=Mycoplasma haematolamae (strain Purdue) TaxID=1212765 RepID=I7B976_MYCHA|nr:hypothetical protein [Candidatus Mycoplasma haematolamae]AFO51830.1 hypothetical protein MHLP_01250 [Candidatus Mycoplasma haematolamae str. Purdue]